MDQESMIEIIDQAIKKCPPYDTTQNYLLESRKIVLFNEGLKQQIALFQHEVKNLKKELTLPQKKIRRKANEISKKYKCQTCNKTYGSEASLNLHCKIKHHALSETESKTQVEHSFQI